MSSPQPAAVPKRSTPGMETYREKAVRRLKENPWVPLGVAATVTALVVASVKLQRGESQKFNYWLRMRVAAQGLTIVAVVAGTWSMRPKDIESPGAHPTAPRNDADLEKRRLEKIAKEKEEFEERLKGAERAEGVEAELRARKGAVPPAAAKPEVRQGNGTSVTSEGGGGSRWWRWFGGWGGPRSGTGSSAGGV